MKSKNSGMKFAVILAFLLISKILNSTSKQ
jgi:hypothetical protein